MVLFTALSGANAQTTWRVPEDASTIQSALEVATSGDIVILTASVYTGAGNRDIDFMGKAVTVRSESGDPDLCVIDCQGSFAERHRGFVFDSGEGLDSRLVGVTITNGFAPSPSDGGAVYIFGASPEIVDCQFVENHADGSGGAVFCSNSLARITGCVFEANTADGGGGMSCTRDAAVSRPIISHCLFKDNIADFGGGFEVRNLSTPRLDYCTFSHNTANGGGGGVGSDNGAFVMRYCTLSGNSANFGGAGIIGSFPVGTTVSNTTITGSLVGSAVSNWDDDFITLTCCNIFGNADGDWTGVIADQYPGAGNISEDPQFCSSIPDVEKSWVLQSDSPCTADQSSCGQIGAWAADCGTVPTEKQGWGGIKAMFR